MTVGQGTKVGGKAEDCGNGAQKSFSSLHKVGKVNLHPIAGHSDLASTSFMLFLELEE